MQHFQFWLHKSDGENIVTSDFDNDVFILLAPPSGSMMINSGNRNASATLDSSDVVTPAYLVIVIKFWVSCMIFQIKVKSSD